MDGLRDLIPFDAANPGDVVVIATAPTILNVFCIPGPTSETLNHRQVMIGPIARFTRHLRYKNIARELKKHLLGHRVWVIPSIGCPSYVDEALFAAFQTKHPGMFMLYSTSGPTVGCAILSGDAVRDGFVAFKQKESGGGCTLDDATRKVMRVTTALSGRKTIHYGR